MGTISKNNINITWDKDNDWGKFSELIIDSISTTLVYEKIEKTLIINVYFVVGLIILLASNFQKKIDSYIKIVNYFLNTIIPMQYFN